MRYLLAILFPPLCVLLCGKLGSTIINIFLTCLFWIPGVMHAFWVLNHHIEDKRTDRIIRGTAKIANQKK